VVLSLISSVPEDDWMIEFGFGNLDRSAEMEVVMDRRQSYRRCM